MINFVDCRNNKTLSFHHKRKDVYEVTIGDDQVVLTETQMRNLMVKLNNYFEDDDPRRAL